ncbi:MAG: type II toxin-antitoxin system Phd/YefM family antitoxin [Chloroflexi bacterium]|nr:type II toxin-antitoxin system Phd/YefM family antitoxin [Chloroflexota bacterium]
MLVELERIVPLTEARARISEIVDSAVGDRFWVIAKAGKPKVAVIDIQYLDDLIRRAWFDDLSARTQGAFRRYLSSRGLDAERISEEEAESILQA